MHLEHNSLMSFYRTPFGSVEIGQEVTLRLLVSSFRVPHKVKLIADDKEIEMYYNETINDNRIYETKIKMPNFGKLVNYHFFVRSDGEESFLRGDYQITVYKPYKTPKWFKKAIVYQIFPTSFYRSGDTPIKGHLHPLHEQPFYKAQQFGGEYLANDSYGGNLYGIIEKLPYLKELGVNTIYLNPIFESPTNHKYNTADYESVDEALGGNKAFDMLVAKAEEIGIRLILDGVFNHTGSDSRYFNKDGRYSETGAYQSHESPYYSWYTFTNYPNEYLTWWGFKTLPKLNLKDRGLDRYLLSDDNSIVKRWIKRGASGWRLDVVDELPDDFVKQLRTEVKKVDEDAVIIGEVWEDASNKVSYGKKREYLLGEELDSVMNYPLREAIVDFVAGKKDAWQFYKRVMRLYENYPKESFYSALNQLGSHDVPRILTALSDAPNITDREKQANFVMSEKQLETAKKRLLLAVCLQMTLPGTPCIYYGDEAGMYGFGDPFNRAAFPWGNEDKTISDFYKGIIALRNENDAFSTGKFIPVYSEDSVFAYIRKIEGEKDVFGNKANDGSFLVVLNASDFDYKEIELDLMKYNINKLDEITGNRIKLVLEPLGCRIFKAGIENV